MEEDDQELKELLENPSFREWVFRPTRELQEYWESYLRENPSKQYVVISARCVLEQAEMMVKMDIPDTIVIGRMFHVIQKRKHFSFKRTLTSWSYKFAAAALILIGAYWGWCYWNCKKNQDKQEITYQQLTRTLPATFKEYANYTDQPVSLLLADSSEVLLEPGSRISYDSRFVQNHKREVYLDGTAFFNVRHNAMIPFVVYANELVTSVLGTRFWIANSIDREEVSVEVVTGKVAVSTREEVHLNDVLMKKEAMLLTPNQQLLYSRHTMSIRKQLVSRPQIVNTPIQESELEFDDAPVANVFKAVEKAYEVEIEFDSQRLGACLVTASLSGEQLYDTISAVCEAINARYQVVDTRIVIDGYGCS